MAIPSNFMYFENSKIGVNMNEVVAFRIGEIVAQESPMAISSGLIFEMKDSSCVEIEDKKDIENFEQNHL